MSITALEIIRKITTGTFMLDIVVAIHNVQQALPDTDAWGPTC